MGIQSTAALLLLPLALSFGAEPDFVKMANTGHCAAALPGLVRSFPLSHDPETATSIGNAGVKCGLALGDRDKALFFLSGLQRRFPHDPAVLYLATHVYSDLATNASSQLLANDSSSPEAHELNAEALESMGKWDDAAQEYRGILAKHPDVPGIHYRLGRLLLSAPQPADAARQQAKQEFELELKVDPANAGAHFVLGELARQADDLPTAMKEFSAAANSDASFAEAHLGLGRVLMATDQPAKAIAPLETAERLQPENPEVHFQLANAYRKTGRIADATREAKIHQEALARSAAADDEMHRRVTGTRASPAQTK